MNQMTTKPAFTIDLSLARHEVGHVLAYALLGADKIFCMVGEDDKGDYAVVRAVDTKQDLPGPMNNTAMSTVAGAVTTCLLDDLMTPTQVLLAGKACLDLCGGELGVCPDDLEDSKAFEDVDLHKGALRIALTTIANRQFMEYLAQYIAKKSAQGEVAAFDGAGILSRLNEIESSAELANHPHLFLDTDSRVSMVETYAAHDAPVPLELVQDMTLRMMPSGVTQ